MTDEEHYGCLENMYLHAPSNQSYEALNLRVTRGRAVVTVEATPALHHAGKGMHGAHYFKLMDDAAFFAANSLITDSWVLTAQFSIQLFRPVATGQLRAEGTVTKPGRSTIFAEAVLYGPEGKELGRGHGSFSVTSVPLESAEHYAPRPA